jgi:hypothetical protein
LLNQNKKVIGQGSMDIKVVPTASITARDALSCMYIQFLKDAGLPEDIVFSDGVWKEDDGHPHNSYLETVRSATFSEIEHVNAFKTLMKYFK